MPTIQEIIEQLEALPFEDRVRVADSLLRSLNQPDPAVDARWAEEAKRRLAAMRSGKVDGIPADEVFAKARERFSA